MFYNRAILCTYTTLLLITITRKVHISWDIICTKFFAFLMEDGI